MRWICNVEPFVDLTIQISELHPVLMELVDKLGIPRSREISEATWSFFKNADSTLCSFTVRFDDVTDERGLGIVLEDRQHKVLEEIGKLGSWRCGYGSGVLGTGRLER